MSTFEFLVLDEDVSVVQVHLSSLGRSQSYEVSAANDWIIETDQELGTYTHLELYANEQKKYSTPMSTIDKNHLSFHFIIDEQSEVHLMPPHSVLSDLQYLWGLGVTLLFLSLMWRRS